MGDTMKDAFGEPVKVGDRVIVAMEHSDASGVYLDSGVVRELLDDNEMLIASDEGTALVYSDAVAAIATEDDEARSVFDIVKVLVDISDLQREALARHEGRIRALEARR